MPPPRASAAGGSPVLLRSDGSLNPSDSAHYSACALQLQASSQPLQPEQLGLLLPGGGARAACWMRHSSCGGAGGGSGGGMGASGSCGGAAGGTSAGGACPHAAPAAGLSRLGSNMGPPEQWAALLRCSDSSCTGAPALAAAATTAAAAQAAATAQALGSDGGASSPFAAAPGPSVAAHPGAGAAPEPGCAADAALAQLCGPMRGASGRLPSAPSRGLSGLLWDGGSAADAMLCGGGGGVGGQAGGGGQAGAAGACRAGSQDLLMEAFRDMQGLATEGPAAPATAKRERAGTPPAAPNAACINDDAVCPKRVKA
jgi:hypothetical protein